METVFQIDFLDPTVNLIIFILNIVLAIICNRFDKFTCKIDGVEYESAGKLHLLLSLLVFSVPLINLIVFVLKALLYLFVALQYESEDLLKK
ncbi:hypothetical protein [Tenacibaculum phage Larrie]|nr:hypothetical protein [Tenacibaculum phage Larrie]